MIAIARVFGLTAMLALGLAGCSDPRKDVTRPSGPEASVHPDGWLTPSAQTFHGKSIRSAHWDMSACKGCHGADYAGGSTGTSCLTCHTQTPEGCQTCHGTRGESAAPPQDLSGNTQTTAMGVGAHRAHVMTNGVSTPLQCVQCHPAVDSFADPSHVGSDNQAEVQFDSLALAGGSHPTFDAQTGTCAGTYCHSGGRFGRGQAVVWNQVGQGAAACGTCHGLPPAPQTGHPSVPAGTACSACHANVDAQLHIVDPTLHINRQTEVSASLSCGSCHALPPAPETGHPVVTGALTCAVCHADVDAHMVIIDPSMHGNGQVEASCGTCHALPPAEEDHPQSDAYLDVTQCSMCHSSVIDDDYSFIDASLHGNGRVDF